MINKYRSENKPNMNMTTSTVVTESTSYTRTTTMTYTGGQTRTEFQSTSSTTPGKSLLNSNISTVPNMLSTSSSLPSRSLQPFSRGTEIRTSSYHPPSSGVPYNSATEFRSAFNNQPRGIYNSFNGKTSVMPTTEKKSDEKEKKSGIFSIFKRSDKEKEDMKKAKEEAKAKKEREIAAKEEAKAKREREIAAKEKEKKEKAAREKEKEAKEKEEKENKKKAKKLKNKKDEKATSVTAYDAKLMNNGFSSNNRNYFGLQDRDEQLVIKVTKTGIFHPRTTDKVPTYKTKSRYSRGRVLLINNIDFPGLRFRHGAEVDDNNMIQLCKDMGFKIANHRNKSQSNMDSLIQSYCRDSSLKYADIHITIVMSHGGGEGNNTYIETTDNKFVTLESIVNEFSNEKCSYLANKPKIFIFQCCRGKDEDVLPKKRPPPQTDAVRFIPARNNADMLLAYATVPGSVSHRDVDRGTWYIQSICKIFMEHAHDTDVENLLKIVDTNLEKTYVEHRQTSSYENRGFKRCFLNPI